MPIDPLSGSVKVFLVNIMTTKFHHLTFSHIKFMWICKTSIIKMAVVTDLIRLGMWL